MEEGKVTHPDRGTPQGGVISPLLSNIVLHEVDRQWCCGDGTMSKGVVLVGYADDRVLLARTASRGPASVGQPSKPVGGSTLGSEPGEEPSHDGEGGFRVSGLRVSETPGPAAIYVAAHEGVPTHPGPGTRSGPVVPQ